MGAAVDTDGAAEPVGLFIDRPIALIAEVGLNPRRRQHRAAHTDLFDDSAKLFDRGLGFLQGNQTHATKSRAALHVGIVEPIVVRASDIDSPVAADDLAKSKSESGVKDGGFDADIFQKFNPAVGPDFIERAGLEIVQIRRMKMIERRKGIKETVGVVFVPIRVGMNSTMALVSSITCPSPSMIVWPLNGIRLPPLILTL